MSFGAPLKYFSRHCRQQHVTPSLPRRERASASRHERRPVFFNPRFSPTLTPSVPRIDPKRPSKLNALQQSPLLASNKSHTIHLPIEYIQLLGFGQGENLSESKILRAFEELSAYPVEDGYSARAVASRQQVLEDAKEVALKSLGKKMAPDKNKGIELAHHLIPGALSILVQVEGHDLVMQLGAKMLESRDASNMKRDILLSMAWATLGQAEYYLSTPSQRAMACTCMADALDLLASGGQPQLAPDLCKEIEDHLETYVPQVVLDQIKLPLSADSAKGRKHALTILKGLLSVPKTSDHSRIGVDRHYVKQVLDCLTSTEVLETVDWSVILHDPKCVKWYYPGLLLKGAASHIVVGFLQRRPALLGDMDNILSLPGKDREAHVEHVICKVLKGDVEGAFEILDRAEGVGKLESLQESKGGMGSDQNAVGAKVLPGRNETLAFIRANADPNAGGDLAGLNLFVERWLQNAGFLQFKDTATGRLSAVLLDYLKDKKVQSVLNSSAGSHNGLFGLMSMNKPVKSQHQTLPSYHPQSNGTKPAVKNGESIAVEGQGTVTFAPQSSRLVAGTQLKRFPVVWVATLGGLLLGSAVFAAVRHPWMRASADFVETKTTVIDTPTELNTAPVIAPVIHKKRLTRPLLPLRKADAQKLVEKWQSAKSRALGRNHDFKYMRRVLADPMLGTWIQNIQEVAERGWYWEYKLEQCKVTHMDSSHLNDDGGYVEVKATLKEKAIMFGGTGEEMDRYKSRYHVGYQMIMDEEGRWRISDVRVLTPHT